MEQADNYEFHRERMEAEREADAKKKENFDDVEMNKLQSYFEDVYDVMSDDPDAEEGRFMNWFEDQPYHELLEILNK